MKCTACSADIPNDSTFCPKCGAKLGAAPAAGGFAANSGNPANVAPGVATLARAANGAGDEEQKLWSGDYSAKAMVGSWLIAGLATIGLGVACVFVPPGIPVFAGVILLIWLSLGLVFAVRKMGIHYELTTQRLVHQRGILTRTSDRIEMIDIDDVTFTQSLVERIFDVGTIKIASSDRTDPNFLMIGISEVKRVADLIDDTRRKERRKRGLHIENI